MVSAMLGEVNNATVEMQNLIIAVVGALIAAALFYIGRQLGKRSR